MTSEQFKETFDDASTAKLVSLLHAQPKVKAPVDFMAQLQMRMAEQSAVSEDARLKSLLQAVPAVAAPPDFAFRVKAGLAKSKAEAKAQSPLAWLESWFAQSFSFGQAAGAMAAIALIVAVTTVQLRNGNTAPTMPTTSNDQIARFEAPVQAPAKTFTPTAIPTNPVRTVVHRTASAPKAPAMLVAKAEIAAQPVSRSVVEPAVYNAKTKQEVYLGQGNHAYGQQLAKVMAAKNAETTIAAF